MWYVYSFTRDAVIKDHKLGGLGQQKLCFKIFFFDVDHFFKTIYWICYNIASVLCFGFFGPEACGILAPRPRIKPSPTALEDRVLTIGPPGKSLEQQKFIVSHFWKLEVWDHMSAGSAPSKERCISSSFWWFSGHLWCPFVVEASCWSLPLSSGDILPVDMSVSKSSLFMTSVKLD